MFTRMAGQKLVFVVSGSEGTNATTLTTGKGVLPCDRVGFFILPFNELSGRREIALPVQYKETGR